jgi:lipoprotein-releasing system ATP-binding protein
MSKKETILELRNIYKDYRLPNNVVEVLKDFSLKLYPGEIVGVVGASGSGKSTMLHIAGLLDKPDSGEVVINGKVIKDHEKARTEARLKSLGFISISPSAQGFHSKRKCGNA